MPGEIEEALAAWRDAQRRLDNAMDGYREALETEVERERTRLHQLSARGGPPKGVDALDRLVPRRGQ